jgi:DNA repair protein RecO (recombination protein O)
MVGGLILMPNWNDEAIILNVKEFGETSLLLTLFSKEHGKWSGLLKNSNNQSQKAVLQPGNIIKAEWYARIDEQLGTLG